MDSPFYRRDGDAFVATTSTRGPWDVRFQHGGPPAALLTRAMRCFGARAPDFGLVRINIELYKPVPLSTLTVAVAMERDGRTVQRLHACLSADGKMVMAARGLRIRYREVEVPPPPPLPDWPSPDSLDRFIFPFFEHEVGYHRAVDLRVAQGRWGRTPVAFWARPLVPLIEGEATSALERLVILADAQSGMGVPLDPRHYTFVNPDMTVHIERPPEGEWLGFDIRSAAGPRGAGLSQSAIRDLSGAVGRSAQSLVVAAR